MRESVAGGGWLRGLAACLALGGACTSSRAPEGDGRNPPPLDKTYGDGPDGLHALWADILEAARRDERQRTHDLVASLIMTDADLDAVFGPERAAYLRPRYLPMIAKLVNAGSMELIVQVHERKYDDVEVFAVTATDGGASEADTATLRALASPMPIYGVRLKRKAETRGLRYDFFVYRPAVGPAPARGRWVTGNQLAKYLVPDAAAAPRPVPARRPDAGR